MSAQEASGSAHDAANTKNVQQCSCDTIPRAKTGSYQALYTPHEKCRIPGAYLVGFHPSHTIAKHFAFLGLEFEVIPFKTGYGADLDDQLFNAIRHDPGVRHVEDDVFGTRD